MTEPDRPAAFRRWALVALTVAVSLYTIVEVNFRYLKPLPQLAAFAMLGLPIALLLHPTIKRFEKHIASRAIDWLLAALAVGCCGYIAWHGTSIDTVAPHTFDLVVAFIGTAVVIEAARRTVGIILPILAIIFMLYAVFGLTAQWWPFPYQGKPVEDVAGRLFLSDYGIFGTALKVMFRYVLLFVLLGGLLEVTGGTRFIIALTLRLMGNRSGGPAKVAVIASGLMGSLSGSAVANSVTTGTFTIPLMRSSGMPRHTAAGIEAAASSGGALMPPIMGAGAYMMLELIEPQVSYMQIIRAAIVPAILYYLSIFLFVHFYAIRLEKDDALPEPSASDGTGAGAGANPSAAALADKEKTKLDPWEGVTFIVTIMFLVGLLIAGVGPTWAAAFSIALPLVVLALRPQVGRTWERALLLIAILVPALIALGMVFEPARHLLQRCVGFMPEHWPIVRNILGNSTLDIYAVATTASIVGLIVAIALPFSRRLVLDALRQAGRTSAPLIAATACVGIIIDAVAMTGIGSLLPNRILSLVDQSMLMTLLAIMGVTLVLGMGLPSAVCYLMVATLIGRAIEDLGVVPLSAHLFIFYFGMMSMVTPPVALAGYATASIADAPVMRTSFTAFRVALVGFALPFLFIYQPQILLLEPDGSAASWPHATVVIAVAVVGIVSLAASLAGCLFTPLHWALRIVLLAVAVTLIAPTDQVGYVPTGIALGILLVVAAWNYIARSRGARV